MRPIRVDAPLPDTILPSADWADRFEIELPNGQLTPIEAARLAFAQSPGWVTALLAVRNRIVGPLGLKTGPRAAGVPVIGLFPVISESDREAVLGFDDRHLNFRVVVDIRPNRANGQVIGLTTLVERKNLFGRIYLALVTPFHRVIVPAFLAKLDRSRLAVN
ncbi:DUF2867 domain-containing protein [Pararhizobium sp.]|uniref:DUF2867 domain-containing protein n=1 Tax=Pararhizobium sp. TaxID=1977563 RepID=UPI00271B35C3|nr:DUF2867 domain-containing protein [Pararhizobium sp.]MDO9416511.1 DUF2867 domain-containing protein [Pararhizobium sp.]